MEDRRDMNLLFKLTPVDGGYDVVALDGTVVGYVHRAPDQAWSYAPWVIAGDYTTVRGGVNGAQKRRRGWQTRERAVREVCIMNSAALIRGFHRELDDQIELSVRAAQPRRTK